MEEDKVPQEERGKKKKWTSSLMRSLTQMQMGIDCCCPSELETVCVCVVVWVWVCTCVSGQGCVFICHLSYSQYNCLVHLLHLSLYEQSVIILLSSLTGVLTGFFFPL